MANNKLWIVCNHCKKSKLFAKYGFDEWYFPPTDKTDSEVLQQWEEWLRIHTHDQSHSGTEEKNHPFTLEYES